MTASLFIRKRVFTDSSAYYGLTDQNDTNAPQARQIATFLTNQHWHLYTTNVILAETYSLILSRLGRHIAYPAVRAFRDSRATRVIRVQPRDERRAWEILGQYDDKPFSFVDATCYAVMERLHIPYAFSFDEDFTKYPHQTVLTPEVVRSLGA
ncbi:MAG: type II toxin-antitoxin system VapC family toxin [Dehalococcoidia bacterium]